MATKIPFTLSTEHRFCRQSKQTNCQVLLAVGQMPPPQQQHSKVKEAQQVGKRRREPIEVSANGRKLWRKMLLPCHSTASIFALILLAHTHTYTYIPSVVFLSVCIVGCMRLLLCVARLLASLWRLLVHWQYVAFIGGASKHI